MAERWLTTHSVFAVGRPLLAKGVKQLRPGEAVQARLRVAGGDDVVVSAEADRTTIALAGLKARPSSKPTTRRGYCCCGGQRPADPSRIRGNAGPEALGRLRRLLSGY